MKIAFFTDSYKPYTSGVVRSIDLFTKKLREFGHQVFILAPDYPEARREEGLYRFPSLPAVTHPSFRLAVPFSTRINNKIKEIEPDIIHTHSPFMMGLLARYMADKLNVPLVFTYHTLYEKYAHYIPLGEELIRSLALKYIINYCNKCDLLVTPSRFVNKKLNNMSIKTPKTTIPTGIDLELYNEKKKGQIREEYDIDNEEKLFLFVGRLGKEKNIELLLKSFQRINQKYPQTTFLIVGDGPERDRLKEVSEKLDISKDVIFTGLVSYEEVANYYLDCDIFFFASPTETQGIVILEAMAGGMPVITVDEAGAGLMVDQGVDGILVDNKEDELVEAGLELITNQDRYQSLAQNALEKAEGYSMEKMTEKLIKMYEGIIQLGNSEERFLA